MVFLYGAGQFPAYSFALCKIGQQVRISQDIAMATNCAGLLLPGGGDIHGKLDDRETAVIDYFMARQLPILGICRGMQALNVYFGGTLYDKIPGHQSAQGDRIHASCAAEPLSGLLGPRPVVNSNHHQAVKQLGRNLVPCQWASDGIIEAIYHKALPILGVQWHPERWAHGDAVFQWFASEIAKRL